LPAWRLLVFTAALSSSTAPCESAGPEGDGADVDESVQSYCGEDESKSAARVQLTV